MGNLHFHSGYIWLFVILLGLGIAITVRRYLRYDTSLFRRWLLILLRILTLLLLCNLASEPALDSYQRTIRPHTLAILLDTSQSMRFQENGEERWETAKHILTSCDMPDAVQMQVYRWEDHLLPVEDVATLSPEDEVTDLGAALQAALDQLQAERPATLFLISDGAHNHGPSPLDADKRARSMNLPIHTILVGGDGPHDIETHIVSADAFAFIGGQYSVEITLRHRGFSGLRTQVIVEREDEAGTWQGITTVPVQLSSTQAQLKVSWTPSLQGMHHYRIRLPDQPNEAMASNNVAGLRVTVIENKLRVRYLERSPRWDFRFLRNAMLRDPRIELNWRLGASEFDLSGLADDDLLFLGDMPSGWLHTHAQTIADFVDAGGGLLLQPGRQHAWEHVMGSKLADLLPVQLPSGESSPRMRAYLPEVTQVGRQHPASMEWGRFLDDSDVHSSHLFHWYYPVQSLKPSAAALMVHPTERVSDQPVPLVAYQHYGRGRILYVGLDELWRWKKGLPESEFYQLWSPAVQWLAVPHLLGDLGRVQLTTDALSYEAGQTIYLTARVRDDDYLPDRQPTVEVRVTPGEKHVTLASRMAEPGVYEGALRDLEPGQYVLTLQAADAERVFSGLF